MLRIIGFAWCTDVLDEATSHHTHLAGCIACPMTTVYLHHHNKGTNYAISEAVAWVNWNDLHIPRDLNLKMRANGKSNATIAIRRKNILFKLRKVVKNQSHLKKFLSKNIKPRLIKCSKNNDASAGSPLGPYFTGGNAYGSGRRTIMSVSCLPSLLFFQLSVTSFGWPICPLPSSSALYCNPLGCTIAGKMSRT